MNDSLQNVRFPSYAQPHSQPPQGNSAGIAPSAPAAVNDTPSPSEKAYRVAREKFDQVSAGGMGDELVVKIRGIVNMVGKNIGEWDVSQLATAEERLARYSESLGTAYVEADTRAEFLSAYIKDQMAKGFNTTKAQLETTQGKTTVTEIERTLTARQWEDLCAEIFWRGRAKTYRAILESIDRVILAITHRIRSIERDLNTSRNPRL